MLSCGTPCKRYAPSAVGRPKWVKWECFPVLPTAPTVAQSYTIIQRLYEDNISGKLTDERFKKLSEAYEQEQTALRGSVPTLAAQLQDADDKMLGVQHFLKAVRKYTQPEKLTAAMLRELVEKVVVYAPDKSSGNRVQRIDVYYTFIGKIDFSPEYSKKGTA